ncbi:MAG TPA: redoxin family protein [Thermoanaerobaculia bacterium]
MVRDLRIASFFLLALGFSAAMAFPGVDQPDPPAAAPTPLEEARDLMEEENYKDAIRSFKQADKLAGGNCLECQLGLARAHNKIGAYKVALERAEAAIRLAKDEPNLALAYHEQGTALFALAGDDPKILGQAEKAFREVLAKTQGKINAVRYNLAAVLLRQGRDADGVALLKEYLENEPDGAYAESARELIKTPLRARKRLVPDFELVTLSGDYLTSEDLRGKVILLDFWATWCAPCVAALPDLKELARRKAKDPFVLLSVSADHDEAALRAFLNKNGVTWPQVWEKSHEFIHQCKVNRFPTYLLVDHTGEIVYSASGWGPGIERELESRIFFAIRTAKKNAKPAGD